MPSSQTHFYGEYPPSPALRPYVRCFWMARTPAADLTRAAPQRVLPDGCMDIILARLGPASAGPDAFALTVVGAMTRYLDAEPLPHRLGVRFEPGMGPLFLRAPASALTDVEVSLGEFWGDEYRKALRELARTRSIAGRIRIMERWLVRRMEQAGAIDAAVLDVIARIVTSAGEGSVGPLTRGARLSERQLRRRFEAAVGFGPKHLARIVRLRATMERAAATPGQTWARIAADAGYYDQAHMIAEFRALTGRTPVELVGARA